MPLLDELLRRPLRLIEARDMRLGAGRASTPALIVDSPRLLVVARGRLCYTIEGRTVEIAAGQSIFVPALVHRQWRSVTGACRVVFFSFESEPPLRMEPVPLVSAVADLDLECRAIARIAAAASAGRFRLAEGEMKAVLARLLGEAAPPAGWPASVGEWPGGIRAAMRWLETHYAEPGCVHDLHRRAELSPWHFRRMFRRLVGRTPSEVVMGLRMRAARSYLADQGLSVKAVAARVGFADPLYFSRCYRRFWGHPPSRRGDG